MTNRTTYQPPIDKLLTLGNQQYNYVSEFGFGMQHIPDLIRMGIDRALLNADSVSVGAWAPIHAWRVLGMLRAKDAIEPLMQLFHELEDSDLVAEEMPKVYGMIGQVAIPLLKSYLAQESHKLFPRVTAINSLEEIANQDENARSECIEALTEHLKSSGANLPELNGFIVSSLINLQAIESAPVIKYAFNRNLVSEDVTGSWDEVQESLGIASDEELEEFQPQPPQQIVETVELAVSSTQSTEEIEDSLSLTQPTIEEIEDAAPLIQPTIEDVEDSASLTQPAVEEIEDAAPLTQPNIEDVEDSALLTQPNIEEIEDSVPSKQPTEELETTIPPNQPLIEELEDVAEITQAVIEETTPVEFVEIPSGEATTAAVQETNTNNVEAIVSTEETVEFTGDLPEEQVTKTSLELSDVEIKSDNEISKEDNKGFGRDTTAKEKPKAKKKKRNFTDL